MPLCVRTARPRFSFSVRARGVERDDSDLDLFIDYDPAAKIPSMFRLMQIEEEISETSAFQSPLRRGTPFTP